MHYSSAEPCTTRLLILTQLLALLQLPRSIHQHDAPENYLILDLERKREKEVEWKTKKKKKKGIH
jgi:hypothetical protein